jgi:hypothetical protein
MVGWVGALAGTLALGPAEVGCIPPPAPDVAEKLAVWTTWTKEDVNDPKHPWTEPCTFMMEPTGGIRLAAKVKRVDETVGGVYEPQSPPTLCFSGNPQDPTKANPNIKGAWQPGTYTVKVSTDRARGAASDGTKDVESPTYLACPTRENESTYGGYGIPVPSGASRTNLHSWKTGRHGLAGCRLQLPLSNVGEVQIDIDEEDDPKVTSATIDAHIVDLILQPDPNQNPDNDPDDADDAPPPKTCQGGDGADPSKCTISWPSLAQAESGIETDPTVLAALRRWMGPCKPEEIVNKALADLNVQIEAQSSSVPWRLANQVVKRRPPQHLTMLLPTAGAAEPAQLLWVDATRGPHLESIDLLSGKPARVWAFNMTESESLAVVQGETIGSSDLAILIAYGITAGIGAPLSITPSATPPTTTPAAAVAAAVATCLASCNGPSCGATCTTAAVSSAISFPADGSRCGTASPPVAPSPMPPAPAPYATNSAVMQYVEHQVYNRLAGKASNKYSTSFAFPQVTGAHRYIAEILASPFAARKPTAASATNSGGVTPSPTIPGGTVIPSTIPVIALESFKSHNAHRRLSVGIEEAWNYSPAYATSGYGYVPVAQSGTDQLYQLQGVTHVADELTFSTLLLWYPLPTWCSGTLEHLFLGFGPTLLRGANAELFRQWNGRLGYELFADVAVDLGVSARNLDVPTTESGSLISVPKPTTAPAFATVPHWEPVFSAGLTIDLDIIGTGISAISTAASGASSKVSK